MFEKPNSIALSGSEYPVKCDMLVLEKVQEKYGDLSAFENRIRKFIPDTDDKGDYVKNKDGLIVGHYEYPDIAALMDLTYWSICEGMEISGKECELTRKELIRLIDVTPLELSEIMHAEYIGAFQRKNPQTAQSRRKNQKN